MIPSKLVDWPLLRLSKGNHPVLPQHFDHKLREVGHLPLLVSIIS